MKRLFSLTLAMVMLVSLFAGCTPAEKPQTSTDKPVEKPKEGERKMRTDVIYASGVDIITLDPADSNDAYSGEIHQMIYDRLVVLDGDANILPALAESWENPTPDKYIFKIRKGVKFHNGDELKASDVAFTLLRAQKNPKSKTILEQVKSVVAKDDYTVELTTTGPFAPMVLNLAANQASILSEKVVTEAEANGGKYGEKPVGTGIMKFQSWKANDNCKVVRWDDYWNGKTRTTSIIRRVIPEITSQTISLETGEIDYVNAVASVDIARIRANPELKAVEMVSSNIAYMGMNTTKAPFNKKEFRQALHYAVNKDNIVKVLYEGFGVPCKSVLPTIMKGFDTTLDMYTRDIEKAKELMIKAGYPDGISIEVAVSSDERSRAAQLMQSDFKDIGVELKIELLEFGAFLDYLSRKNHDMWIMSWNGATNHDTTFTNNFHSEKGGPTGNRMWYNNPEVDKLIVEGRTTLEWEKREEIYKKLQRIIMEDSVWIPLLQQTYVAGMNKNLDGVVMHKTGSRYYTNMVVYED